MNPSSRVSTSDHGHFRAFQCGKGFKFRQFDRASTLLTDDNIRFAFASDYPSRSMLLLPGGYQPAETIETPWIRSLFSWNPSGGGSRCQMEPDTGFFVSGPHYLPPRPTCSCRRVADRRWTFPDDRWWSARRATRFVPAYFTHRSRPHP
jgi:hypothetical protein